MADDNDGKRRAMPRRRAWKRVDYAAMFDDGDDDDIDDESGVSEGVADGEEEVGESEVRPARKRRRAATSPNPKKEPAPKIRRRDEGNKYRGGGRRAKDVKKDDVSRNGEAELTDSESKKPSADADDAVGPSRKKKTDARAFSIGAVGLTLSPRASAFLRCDKLGGVLRISNVTDGSVRVRPSASVRRKFGCDDADGDDLPGHLPVGWGQSHEVRFQVIRVNSDLAPGGSRELDRHDLERIAGGGGGWTMEELMGMVKPLPGSEGKVERGGHYLGYRRKIWNAVENRIEEKGVRADVILDVCRGRALVEPYDCNPGERAIMVSNALRGASVAFVVPKDVPAAAANATPHTVHDALDPFLESIGTGGCVSLLQKVVRRRPRALRHPDTGEEFDAPVVLGAIVRRLLDPRQPGIFLPDAGVYVSARQQLLKRIWIIMAEDSEYSDENACLLAGAALLLECDASWEPPASLTERWEGIAVELWRSPCTSDFDADKGFKMAQAPVVPFDPRGFSSSVLEEIGGMRGDRGMLRWLRTHPRNTVCQKGSPEPSGVDSLDIYCDQHVTGNYVYLWKPRTKRGPPNMPYGPELNSAFHLVSGRNPRRQSMSVHASSHVNAILKAMAEASRIIRGMHPVFPDAPTADICYKWDVPEGALAGMLGPVEVKVGKQTIMVTVDPTDIRRFVAIPKPSRSSDLKDITNDERAEALRLASEVFASGKKLGSAAHPSLNGQVAAFKDGVWAVGGVNWQEKRKVTYSLVRYPKWDASFQEILPFESPASYTQQAMQWAAGRIGGYEPVVHMPAVSRDGSGTKESLTGLEAEAYCLLRKLSSRYPDALWPEGRFSFRTRCIPLRLEIRDRLLASLKTDADEVYPEWSDDRKLRPLQKEALEGMLQADAAGMANFLWMLVGSGKSMTVLSFINETRRSSQTLWCLPMTAMKSVAQEIRRAGWKVRVLASTKGRLKNFADWATKQEMTLDTSLKLGTVTLVEHDDVRNLVAALSHQMVSTTFVYDEVHKAMCSKTQRTGSALRLAQLSKQMVAFTGTPIVNSRAYTLISWLRF